VTLTDAQRAKGGRATRTRPRTVDVSELPTAPRDTLEGLREWTMWVTTATLTGQIDRNTANIVLKALTLEKALAERLGIDQRLKRVEAQLRDKGPQPSREAAPGATIAPPDVSQ